jgi:DNA-binding NtrC family response regulator
VNPADLDLRDLLAPAIHGGTHAFASHRVILMPSDALWTLREQLIERLGSAAARTVLTQLGCAWGWHTADAIGIAIPWRDLTLWSHALPALQALVGLGTSASTSRRPKPTDQLEWSDSFEGHQQLVMQRGGSEPACWVLAGFASGYLSKSMDGAVTCVEEACIAMGDPVCRFNVVTPAEPAPGPSCTSSLHHFDDQAAALHIGESNDNEADGTHHEARRRAIHSTAMHHIFDLATRVAPLASTVLIVGETGVGKERIAKYIHEQSRRKRQPFVAINCGALSETLLESELFGHGRGAFTGAMQERAGLFEAAHGGTIFLDEIGEMPFAMQVKLLRVLQEREVRRLGENAPRRIDVRVVVATNRQLDREVIAGRFREDLYYRLRVVELHIPPLRERPEDLRALIRILLEAAARAVPCAITGFTPHALDVLLRYHWPGNVRELENAIERACALARGPLIEVTDLPQHLRNVPSFIPPQAVVRPWFDVERDYILAALALNGGNRAVTAEQLGIGPATLFRKLRRYARRNRSSPG